MRRRVLQEPGSGTVARLTGPACGAGPWKPLPAPLLIEDAGTHPVPGRPLRRGADGSLCW